MKSGKGLFLGGKWLKIVVFMYNRVFSMNGFGFVSYWFIGF